MSWISLICLLALSSSAWGRSAYGSSYGSVALPPALPPMSIPRTLPTFNYGSQEKTIPRTLSSYGSSMMTPMIPRTIEPVAPTYGGQSYGGQSFGGQSFGGASLIRNLPVQPIVPSVPFVPPTEAEMLCRGLEAGTVIPTNGNRKFIICIGDNKGYEQECPKGLYYHPESRRCERKLGPLENACVTQPCLNGGQCFPEGSSYQCQCAPGFSGKTCEMDARICQSQQPCGQGSDVTCQSFRLGAALPYVCIFQSGSAYGLSPQQIFGNPCNGIDGPQRLAFGNKGFILCDGERFFVESCPGGTIWDDFNKACTWPDQEGVITGPMFDQEKEQYSYGQERPTIKKESFVSEILPVPEIRKFNGYGAAPQTLPAPLPTLPKVLDRPTGYGSFVPPPPPRTPEISSGYGSSFVQPTPVPVTPRTLDIPTGYGTPMLPPSPPRTPEIPTGYGSSFLQPTPVPVTPRTLDIPTGYGGSFVPPSPPRTPEISSGYGSSFVQPSPVPVTPRTLDIPTGYGAPMLPPSQPKFLERPTSYGSSQISFPQTTKPFLDQPSGYGAVPVTTPFPRVFQGETFKVKESSGY